MEEFIKETKSVSDEAKAVMKKQKVDTIYYCNGYWFIDETAAENYARGINRKYETHKMK